METTALDFDIINTYNSSLIHFQAPYSPHATSHLSNPFSLKYQQKPVNSMGFYHLYTDHPPQPCILHLVSTPCFVIKDVAWKIFSASLPSLPPQLHPFIWYGIWFSKIVLNDAYLPRFIPFVVYSFSSLLYLADLWLTFINRTYWREHCASLGPRL